MRLRGLVCLTLVLASASALFAQYGTGTILGTVPGRRDPGA
jgi:hypothetical protein